MLIFRYQDLFYSTICFLAKRQYVKYYCNSQHLTVLPFRFLNNVYSLSQCPFYAIFIVHFLVRFFERHSIS